MGGRGPGRYRDVHVWEVPCFKLCVYRLVHRTVSVMSWHDVNFFTVFSNRFQESILFVCADMGMVTEGTPVMSSLIAL